MTDKLKVYFLGTADISVPVLEALINDERVELVGVGTQPDRPKGRKKVLSPCPVGAFAEEQGIAIIDKPVSVNTEEYLSHVQSLKPDVILVIAFGQLLKEPLLNLPRLGCINIHASLLPKYRGASPINAAILSGDPVTGISIMQMEKGLDSGPVFKTVEVSISSEDTYLSLEQKLGKCSSDNIVDILLEIDGGLQSTVQNHDIATHVGKISKNDGLVDWNKPAEQLEKTSRAYFPWPTLHFFLKTGKRERKISVIKATVLENDSGIQAGEFIQADKNGWVVSCGEGALKLDTVKPDGAKAMSGPEFLRGVQI